MATEKMFDRGPKISQSVLGIGVAILVVALITVTLRARVETREVTTEKPPLPVATVVYDLQESYQRELSYLGVVTAGRKANLAFEVPGQIARLTVRQGSPVTAGDTIAELDDARLQALRRGTEADLLQAEADLQLAELKAKRQQDLVNTGSVSREAFDETRLRAAALNARVESISARLAGIDIDLENSRLIAPYDGVIADRYVDEGAVVSAGLPVARLVEAGAREAHIGVAAERTAELREGETYDLKLRGEIIPATLLSIRPDVDPVTRTATAVFALPEATAALDGEPIYLSLTETVPLRGGWLPIAALQEGERGVWTLMRLQDDGQQVVALREGVQVLEVSGDKAYVSGTVEHGAYVVSQGVHRVVPGTPVTNLGNS